MTNPFFKNHGPISVSEIIKLLNIKPDQNIQNQNIDDVNKFEGHIVCDEKSKSELCIPFEFSGIKYVLDVDSKIKRAFCKVDEEYLLKIIREI